MESSGIAPFSCGNMPFGPIQMAPQIAEGMDRTQ